VPSTVVHLALAGLLAAGLLGDALDRRALAVVAAAVVFVDLDVFVGLLVPGTHRAAFHTLLLPLLGAVLVIYDTRVREESWLRRRFGPQSPQIAWVVIAAVAVAASGLDLFTSGANPLYPLHDQFYRVDGRVLLSNQRGFVQTFVELGSGPGETAAMGSTQEVHVGSGVDPTRGAEPANVERIFPVVWSGWQLLLVASSAVVLWGRLRLGRGQ
jgi:hypothetical protein